MAESSNAPKDSREGLQTQEKVLFSWKEKTRPFKRQSRETYITLASVAVLVGVILFIIDGLMPVLLIIALGFLFYVLNNVEPEEAEYKLTTWGIRVAGALTPWENIGRFWFSERLGSDVLVVEKAGLVGKVELVINKSDMDKIKKVLDDYAIHEEVPPDFLDRSANWVASKIQQ